MIKKASCNAFKIDNIIPLQIQIAIRKPIIVFCLIYFKFTLWIK